MIEAGLMLELVTRPAASSLLLTAAAPLIGALGLAIRRSTRRQECAQLRDQLVDAARTGELDVTDWRVFSLIDWFDQVATTGRTDIRGRHTPAGPGRQDVPLSLVSSLVTALRPLETPGSVQTSWSGSQPDLGFEQLDPQAGQLDLATDLRAIAVSYRERHQQRLWHMPRLSLPARTRSAAPEPLVIPSSLVEEIFAVAGPSR
jgi:hypothetical protein